MDVHRLDCDILVAGGGPAGVPCAIAAARAGANVILVQDRPVLGGNASSEVRMHIVGANGNRTGHPLETEAREGGLIEEIRLETAVRNPQRSASMLDLILYEKCRAEPNLSLFLNTTVTAATVEDGRITRATAVRESTEDTFEFRADIFIDCTGDGRLGAEAGAAFRHGREAHEEYGEPEAPAEADDWTLGSTLLFTARKHPQPMPFVPPPWARTFSEDDLRLRPHATCGVDRGLEYGYWWVEWGGTLDTIKDNEAIRDELLAILVGVWDHIKNGGDHGAENWALDWFGFLPGKRESRRFIGQHVLRGSDLLESRPFDDAIAFGGWPIDIHPPRGIDARDERPNTNTRLPHLYDIPLRACVARDIPNLMFAGRNLSATHVAFASTRVMATCAVVGQGVGTAAAYAVGCDRDPAELAADPAAMKAIQQELLRQDCYLIGRLNEDPHDLARQATAAASSELPDGAAANVFSGQTRAVHGPNGAPPYRARPGTHRWISEELPAWLELAWDAPVEIAQVQLIFDTGLDRYLTLSHSDDYSARMEWGHAQPETVADYRLTARVGEDWRELVAVRGNYQRRRSHDFAPVETRRLRLEITATGGISQARVCELRVYGPEETPS